MAEALKPAERLVPIVDPTPPPGKRLPPWFVVTPEQAKLWGSPALEEERATVRISFENHSDQEMNVLNLEFLEARFVVSNVSGGKRTIPVQLGRTACPWINPQMIIGPKSRVSFDVQFCQPSKKSFGSGARFRSEAQMEFWMRDDIDRGKLQSFEYTVPLSVVDAPAPSR